MVHLNKKLHALFYSVYKGNLTFIKKLIAFGVDINLKDQLGANAIFYALFYKQKKLINYLIQNNANINEKDKFGNSALNFAKENHLENLLIR